MDEEGEEAVEEEIEGESVVSPKNKICMHFNCI